VSDLKTEQIIVGPEYLTSEITCLQSCLSEDNVRMFDVHIFQQLFKPFDSEAQIDWLLDQYLVSVNVLYFGDNLIRANDQY
jgi:hypothetical protein